MQDVQCTAFNYDHNKYFQSKVPLKMQQTDIQDFL